MEKIVRKKVPKIVCMLVTLAVTLSLAGCGTMPQKDMETETSVMGGQETTDQKDTSQDGTVDKASQDSNKEIPTFSGDASNTIRSDETLIVAVNSEPSTLVPVVSKVDNQAATIVRCMYEPLVNFDRATGTVLENTLCTPEIIDDTHIRLKLTKGVKFHNGEEFIADDVVYMFEQGKLGVNSADRYFPYDPENFVVEDDYSVIMALNQEWAQATEMLQFVQFCVPSSTALSSAGGSELMVQNLEDAGTGKYRFKEWEAGSHITLVRNEDYWDKNNIAYYAAIEFKFISDTSARGLAVQSGDVNVAGVDNINKVVYDADSNVTTTLAYGGNVSFMFENCAEGMPCNDIRVREAIDLLIDRDEICSIATVGYGTTADVIISPYCPMWDGKNVDADEADVERAKELLAEAGYGDGLNLRMRATSVTAAMEVIQEQLHKGDIEVEFVIAEPAVHFWQGLGIGDYDLAVSSQQSTYYSEPVRCCDGIAYGFGDVMGGLGYKDEALHEICERCLSSIDFDTRCAAYVELQTFLRENYLGVALYTEPVCYLSSNDVIGVRLVGFGEMSVENCVGIE